MKLHRLLRLKKRLPRRLRKKSDTGFSLAKVTATNRSLSKSLERKKGKTLYQLQAAEASSGNTSLLQSARRSTMRGSRVTDGNTSSCITAVLARVTPASSTIIIAMCARCRTVLPTISSLVTAPLLAMARLKSETAGCGKLTAAMSTAIISTISRSAFAWSVISTAIYRPRQSIRLSMN